MEIGKILKEAREARGLTLEEVEDSIKIRTKYIQAMEEEHFEILPGGPVYVRGFLKNYGRFLGLEVEELLGACQKRFSWPEPPESAGSPEQKKPLPPMARAGGGVGSRRLIALALAAAVAGIALFALLSTGFPGLNGLAGNSDRQPYTARSPDDRGPGRSAPPAGPELATGVNLMLDVKSSRSWMQVVVDGSPAFQGELGAGQSKNFEAKDKIYIRLGNAGAVEVTLNGQKLGYLDGPGVVVDREFTAPRS